MSSQCLTSFGGEFRDPEREVAFQSERPPETLRHARLLFLLSAALNALFFLSDWRFYGEPHFYAAIPARATVVVIAIACFLTLGQATTFRQAQRSMIAWQWITAAGVAVLVSSHSEIALFVVLLLPSIYYLAVPTAFRWTVAAGTGCSAMMLAGYYVFAPPGALTLGVVLIMITLNTALVLVLARSNRLQRMEWSATQAEQLAKDELSDSRAMFETMFKTVPIPLLVVRVDGSIVDMNDAALRFAGAKPQSLGIETTHEFYVNPDDRLAFLARIEKNGQISDFETQLRLADGSVRTVLLAGMALEIGGVQHIVASVVDITERKAAEERIWRAASHDPLTGLPNRAFFQSRLEQMLAQAARSGTGVNLLLIDLDNLKNANETLGHDMGDALIKETADRLSLLVRERDCVARLGGDDFVIISEVPAQEGSDALADRVLAELRRPFAYNDHLLACQASIGVASYPHHDRQPSDLMKDADLALQAAKSLGRN